MELQILPVSTKHTPISSYNFDLPKELIAQEPLQNREDARLMIVDRGTNTIEHGHVRDLTDWLNPGDCLVINDTKVILAKLVGYRSKTGGRWQGLFLEHDQTSGVWRVLCKTRGNIQPGEQVTLQDRSGADRCNFVLLARLENGCWAAKPLSNDEPLKLLAQIGRVPLPHYIRGGNMTDSDLDDYQTVFAQKSGSIAAPTAGLHFTHRLLEQLTDHGVSICRVTLHVGTGTFRPITCDTVEEHTMHKEYGELKPAAAETINQAKLSGGRVIAVGTTSVRILETACDGSVVRPWQGATDLFIHSAEQFKCVDALMTNFHLPKTTLLVLVRSFGGESLIKQAYQQAIENRYRFFSYGDAMLVT